MAPWSAAAHGRYSRLSGDIWNCFCRPCIRQQGILGIEIQIGILREANALQRIRADKQLVVQSHFAFHVAVEGRPASPITITTTPMWMSSRRSAAYAPRSSQCREYVAPVCREITPARAGTRIGSRSSRPRPERSYQRKKLP